MDESQRLLKAIEDTIGRVTHEINNPLAIISGNAQYLLELSKTLVLDDDVQQPVEDIEEASRRLSTSLKKLNTMRALLAEGDATPETLSEL